MKLDVHGHRRIDRWITFVLRVGMGASVSVLILGLILYALLPGQASTDLSLAQLPEELAKGNGVAVLDLGILILIATPLSRLFTALAVFIVDKEIKFVAISILVLIVLLAAVLLRL